MLYLIVVKMPTEEEEEEEELVKAKTREIARSKGEKRAASRKERAWFFMIDVYAPRAKQVVGRRLRGAGGRTDCESRVRYGETVSDDGWDHRSRSKSTKREW